MLTPNALGPSGPDWSPDGRRIAFTGANGAIYVINSGGSGLRKVVAPKSRTNTPGERNVRWSPDGKNLLFNSFRGAWTVNATGGRLARLVSSAGIVESASWSPDGKEIAYATSGGIHILNLATRRSRSLSQRPLGAVALDW